MSLRGNIATAVTAGIFGLSLASGLGFGVALIYGGLTALSFASAFAIQDAIAAAPAGPAVRVRRGAAAVAPAPAVAPAVVPVPVPMPWYRTVFNPFAGLFRPMPVAHGVHHTRRMAPAHGVAPGPIPRVHAPAAHLHAGRHVQHTRTMVGGTRPAPVVHGRPGHVEHTRTILRRG